MKMVIADDNINFELIHSNEMDDDFLSYLRENVRFNYSKDIFEWQYGSSMSAFYCVKMDEKIVGSQGMIHTELVYQGAKINSAKSESTFLSTLCRGKGVFEKIYALCIKTCDSKNIDFYWGFTALGELWERKLNFKSACIIKESIIHLRPIAINGSLISLLIGVVGLFNRFLARCRARYTFEINNDLSAFHFLNDFYEVDAIHLDYSSSSFLNRTVNNPFFQYKLMKIMDGSDLVATIIFHIKDNKFILSDIQYKRDTSIDKIINTVVSYCVKCKLNGLSFWANYLNERYRTIFSCFDKYIARVSLVKSMQFVYKTRRLDFRMESLFINSLWTEGFKY